MHTLPNLHLCAKYVIAHHCGTVLVDRGLGRSKRIFAVTDTPPLVKVCKVFDSGSLCLDLSIDDEGDF